MRQMTIVIAAIIGILGNGLSANASECTKASKPIHLRCATKNPYFYILKI